MYTASSVKLQHFNLLIDQFNKRKHELDIDIDSQPIDLNPIQVSDFDGTCCTVLYGCLQDSNT